MTYWRYWQFRAAPFTSDSALFRGATVDEALARIEFLISNRRCVGSLTGRSGVGKSVLLKHVAANPPTGNDIPSLQLMRVSMLGMSPGELLCDIALRLTGGRRSTDAQSAWKILCDYFQAASREGTQTVLLVDDTESCSAAAEADLTRLLAMTFPLTVIFAVESQLASAVSRSLFDRSELQIELPGWEVLQTSEFLAWTCQQLGRDDPIFTDSGVQRVQQLSEGIPRRIVQLADLAMVAGAVCQADCIDGDIVEQVAFELPKSSAA